MDSDDFRFWLIILGAIGVAFAAAIGSTFTVCRHIERMAELGYEEEPVQGTSRNVWKRKTPPPKAEPKWDLTPEHPVVPPGFWEYITTNRIMQLDEYVRAVPLQYDAWTNGLAASIDHLRGEISCLIRNSERLEGKVENRIRPPDVTCVKCGQKHAWSDLANCYVRVDTNGWFAP